jgi:1,4-dihydroxy-2-naphthoate octaprenyltransferase
VEIRTKAVSVGTTAAALAYSHAAAGSLDALSAWLFVPAILLVDMGTTAFNSFFDYWRGEDNDRTNRERDKAIVHEGVPALAALLVALGCFAVAGLLGLMLAAREGAWVLASGAVGMAVGFLYSGGKVPLSHTPLGDLAAGLFLGQGLFVVASVACGSGSVPIDPVAAALAGSPLFFSVAAILSANNACDYDRDFESGRRTLAIALGRRFRAAPFYAFLALSYVAAFSRLAAGKASAIGLASTAAAALATLALAIAAARGGFEHERKGPRMKAALACHALACAASIASSLA